MRDIEVYQGATIRQSVTVEDAGAATATFVATNGTTNVISQTFPFVNLVANMNITATVVPARSYDYYIRIDWADGSVDYLPNNTNCDDGDCEFPQLIICAVPGVS